MPRSKYCKTRGNFITSDFWKTLSIISVLYVAISVVLSPFILWGKLPVEILLHMNIIWGSLLIIIYGSFFIALLICSLSPKGRKWFDRRIQYKNNESRLNELEKRVKNLEKSLKEKGENDID